MKKFSGKQFSLHYAFKVDGPNYCKPVMKGGHTHNHIFNKLCKITYIVHGKKRKLPRKLKKYYSKQFYARLWFEDVISQYTVIIG